MADLPKYQQTGRVYADLPQFDFANVREAFKSSQSMAASLDRLSGFANKFAEKAVEEQAEIWSVENQITPEQLQAANAQGMSLDDLIKSSGGGEIWQKTIRKMQGEQLRVQLENQGRAELSKLQKDIDTGVIDANDSQAIGLKIQSIGNGLFAPLKSVNPDSYVKGIASFGVHGSSVYNDARKKSVEDMKNAALLVADKNLVTQTELDKVVIEGLNDWDSLLGARETSANRVYETYAMSGDTGKALEQSRKYRESYDNLLVNSFVKFTSSGNKNKDYDIVTRMMVGDFGDERKNTIFANMPVDVQDKIIKTALDRRNSNFNAAKQREEAEQFENRVQIRQDKEKLLAGDLPYNESLDLAITMHSKGYIDDGLFKSIANPSETDGNPEVLGKIQYNIAMGVYKTPYDVPDKEYSMLNKQQRKSVWSFSANKQVQENYRNTNAAITDIVGNKIDTGKYSILTKISGIVQRKTSEAMQAGKPVDLTVITREATEEATSDIKTQNLISEQNNAYVRITRIPAVSKYIDKFDIKNVESFINIHGNELDDEDKKELRNQALKFNGYITDTLKSWKDFSSNAKQ